MAKLKDPRQLQRIQFMCDQKSTLLPLVHNNGNMNALMNGLINALLLAPDPGLTIAMAMIGRIEIRIKTNDSQNP